MADRAHHLVFDVIHHTRPVHHLAQIAISDAEELVGTVYQQAHHLVRQGAYRVVNREIVFPGDGTDDLELLVLPHFSQRDDSPLGDAEFGIRHYGIHVHVHHGPEPLAMGAVALRGVEREGMRSGFLEGKAGFRIHQMLGIVMQSAVFVI